MEQKRRLKNQITGSLKLYICCSLLKIRVLYYPRNILIARKKCLHRKVKKWQLNLKEEQIYSSINSNYNHKKRSNNFLKCTICCIYKNMEILITIEETMEINLPDSPQ